MAVLSEWDGRKLDVMKKLLYIVPFLFLACGGEEVAVVQPPAHEVDEKEVALLYIRHCVDCHGEDGALGLMGAKDLTTSSMSKEDRIEIIKNGSKNGKMQPFGLEHYGDLDDSEIEAVAVYLETLRK